MIPPRCHRVGAQLFPPLRKGGRGDWSRGPSARAQRNSIVCARPGRRHAGEFKVQPGDAGDEEEWRADPDEGEIDSAEAELPQDDRCVPLFRRRRNRIRPSRGRRRQTLSTGRPAPQSTPRHGRKINRRRGVPAIEFRSGPFSPPFARGGRGGVGQRTGSSPGFVSRLRRRPGFYCCEDCFDNRSISAHCSSVTGMTDSREMRTRAKSANFGFNLISASDTGRSNRRTGFTSTTTNRASSRVGSRYGPLTTSITPTTAFSFPV
jgi:hypothetical protein